VTKGGKGTGPLADLSEITPTQSVNHCTKCNCTKPENPSIKLRNSILSQRIYRVAKKSKPLYH